MRKMLQKAFDEWVLTLSNTPSFLSSKRIERFVLFNSGLTFYIIYFCYHYKTLDAYSFAMFVAPIFGYAGFNTVKIQKDVKDNVAGESNKAPE